MVFVEMRDGECGALIEEEDMESSFVWTYRL